MHRHQSNPSAVNPSAVENVCAPNENDAKFGRWKLENSRESVCVCVCAVHRFTVFTFSDFSHIFVCVCVVDDTLFNASTKSSSSFSISLMANLCEFQVKSTRFWSISRHFEISIVYRLILSHLVICLLDRRYDSSNTYEHKHARTSILLSQQSEQTERGMNERKEKKKMSSIECAPFEFVVQPIRFVRPTTTHTHPHTMSSLLCPVSETFLFHSKNVFDQRPTNDGSENTSLAIDDSQWKSTNSWRIGKMKIDSQMASASTSSIYFHILKCWIFYWIGEPWMVNIIKGRLSAYAAILTVPNRCGSHNEGRTLVMTMRMPKAERVCPTTASRWIVSGACERCGT